MKSLLLVMSLSAVFTSGAAAQSFCASNGQTTPVTLVERFISADCDTCWRTAPTEAPAAQTLTLDWIVPSAQGDEAPLSAAANRDALQRLASLGRVVPSSTLTLHSPVDQRRSRRLRVAHGVALGGYIGASLAFKTLTPPSHPENWRAWLVLIETIPAGTEGTPVERNLVRNMLQPPYYLRKQLSKDEHIVFQETRPLSIPPGATPERLRVVGWVQDGKGRILSAAQSVCRAPEPSGTE
jgi:hypothetical protein